MGRLDHLRILGTNRRVPGLRHETAQQGVDADEEVGTDSGNQPSTAGGPRIHSDVPRTSQRSPPGGSTCSAPSRRHIRNSRTQRRRLAIRCLRRMRCKDELLTPCDLLAAAASKNRRCRPVDRNDSRRRRCDRPGGRRDEPRSQPSDPRRDRGDRVQPACCLVRLHGVRERQLGPQYHPAAGGRSKRQADSTARSRQPHPC